MTHDFYDYVNRDDKELEKLLDIINFVWIEMADVYDWYDIAYRNVHEDFDVFMQEWWDDYTGQENAEIPEIYKKVAKFIIDNHV